SAPPPPTSSFGSNSKVNSARVGVGARSGRLQLALDAAELLRAVRLRAALHRAAEGRARGAHRRRGLTADAVPAGAARTADELLHAAVLHLELDDAGRAALGLPEL